MYQTPEGRPRSTPPGVITNIRIPPGSNTIVCDTRPARSAEHRIALSRGMRAEYQRRQGVARIHAAGLNKADTVRLWVNTSKYRRIFNLGANIGPHAHAVAKGYETRAVAGAGKWTAWVIAVPDADLPEQYRPSRVEPEPLPAIDRTPMPYWRNSGCVVVEPRPSLWQRFLAWWRAQ